MGVHMFPILNPPPTSLPILSLWVIPVHQPQASCILHQTWTGDSFHIWYYTCFNAILPNLPTLSLSHRVYKTVLYIIVSFAVSYTGLLLEANYFTILYWFCHTSTWIRHGCTCVPNLEPPSYLPPHTIPLGHPSAPVLKTDTSIGTKVVMYYYLTKCKYSILILRNI